MKKSTDRFTDKVENYVKYRPSYPVEAISWIVTKCNQPHKEIFADIGSGTGIFTKLLLDNVGKVYGVEPNEKMRKSAEEELKIFDNFTSVCGTAENTGLNDNSIDYISVAQAFHWFDFDKTMSEFKRILKPNGKVFLIWNLRKRDTEFLDMYEKTLYEVSVDYRLVSTENRVDEKIIKNFIPVELEINSFKHQQKFDWNGFLGRHFSSSYAPKEETRESEILLEKMYDLFNSCAVDNLIDFNYETKVYSGKFT